jgi:sugar/nucleoside kinase (ribokinase family)
MFPSIDEADTRKRGEKIFTRLNLTTLVIHQREDAMAFSKNEFAQKNSILIETPLLLTGAGDNFNAGFCFAQLMGCNLNDSLTIAHLAAAGYIKNGESTDWNTLLEALETV